MVYESGFSTRRTYSSRPVTSSYSVSKHKSTPVDWNKVPFVPRPSLIKDPVTAFGRSHSTCEDRKCSVLDPIKRANIRPDYSVLNEPIAPYMSARDRNRERILNMVLHKIDRVEAGENIATSTKNSVDMVLPHIHRHTNIALPVRRETYRNEKSGAMVTRYVY